MKASEKAKERWSACKPGVDVIAQKIAQIRGYFTSSDGKHNCGSHPGKPCGTCKIIGYLDAAMEAYMDEERKWKEKLMMYEVEKLMSAEQRTRLAGMLLNCVPGNEELRGRNPHGH